MEIYVAKFMLSPVKISSKSSDHDLLLAKSIPRCGMDIDRVQGQKPSRKIGAARPVYLFLDLWGSQKQINHVSQVWISLISVRDGKM